MADDADEPQRSDGVPMDWWATAVLFGFCFGGPPVGMAVLLVLDPPPDGLNVNSGLLMFVLASVVVAICAALLYRLVARARKVIGAGRQVSPAQLPLPQPWAVARRRFERLRAEYAGYECDPAAVLRLPALVDVGVPSTARFVDAFAEALALDTDREPPHDHAAAYRRAVNHACRGWQAARDAADRIRLSRLSAQERRSVERVGTLLAVAERTDNPAERHIAYTKARRELARLEHRIRLPGPARDAIETAARMEVTT